MISDTISEQLRLPKIGQLGYVVPDVNEGIAYCREVLGIKPWMLLDEKPEPCLQYGKDVHIRLKIALAYAGPVQIELIQVIEGESLHLDHLAKTEGILHHLGFMVQDVGKRLEECRRLGIGVLQRGTIRDAGFTVDYAYLDTVAPAGIILELIQWRLGPISLPVNKLVFNAVCRAGSRTLFRGRVIN